MINGFRLTDGELTVCKGVRALEPRTFADDAGIRRVILPSGLERIGDEAFSGCASLEAVTLPESLRELGAACFMDCPKLSRVELPAALRVIGDGAFLGCASLASLKMPEGLTEICQMAFYSSGLREITVPETVEVIGETAFWDCSALRRADVLGASARIGENAFGCCGELLEGFIAPGYPEEASPAEELLYTLLWCSCPEKHGAETSERARNFIRGSEGLIMEQVLKKNNTPAMTGLVSEGLLRPENIGGYIEKALASGQTELTAALLRAGNARENAEEDWTL